MIVRDIYVTIYQTNKRFMKILFFRYLQNDFADGWNGHAGRMEWLRGPDLARGP